MDARQQDVAQASPQVDAARSEVELLARVDIEHVPFPTVLWDCLGETPLAAALNTPALAFFGDAAPPARTPADEFYRDQPEPPASIKSAHETGTVVFGQALLAASGTEDQHYACVYLPTASGHVLAVIDVTDRHQVDQHLRAAEDRRHAAFERSPVGQALVNVAPGPEQGRLLEVNRALAATFGYTEQELLTMSPQQFSHPEDLAVGVEAMADLVAGRAESVSIAKRFLRADGTVIHALLSTSLVHGPSGEPGYAVCHFQDMTALFDAERVAREAAERFRLIVEATSDGVWVLDPAGRTTFANARLAAMLGYTPEEMVGLEVFDFVPEDDEADVRASVARGEFVAPGRREVEIVRRDGSRMPAVLQRSPVEDAAGNVVGAMALVHDATEERRAEAEIEERDRRLRTAFDTALDAMVIADDDRRVVEVNEAAGDLFGLPQDALIGRRIEDFAAEATNAIARRWKDFLGAGQQKGEFDIIRPDGERRCVEFSARANFVAGRHLSIIRDATERKHAEKARELAREEATRLEAALNQAQKLETVGQLAGGIAHDFNNLLAVILHSSEFAMSELEGHPAAGEVAEIRAAAQRAAALTKQLLLMSRKEVSNPQSLDLNRLVSGVGRLLRRTIGENIELAATLDPDTPLVQADINQLEQVLLNLAVNARDAMPNGGSLRVETKKTILDSDFTRLRAGLEPGVYALLSVSDGGTGMTEEVRRRAAEPFFTTKDRGAGTGLGLATAYGIVKEAGGFLEITSKEGAGTTVRIYLPAATQEAEERVTPVEGGLPEGAGQRVLLVEDEDGVRRVTERLLREHGYDVVCAVDPDHALALASQGDFDLVLTDVVMPGMSGPDLADRLRERWPGVGVVYMSGYTDRMRREDPGVRFVGKPFDTRTLLEQVAKALADSPTEAA